jgi:hypothetical protein
LRGLLVGETLGSLGQEGMNDLIERCISTRNDERDVFAQASQRGPYPP